VTSIGGGGFSVHTNFKFSIHSNTAWVKHDEVSISKDGERSYTKEIRFLEISNKWKLVGQTGHIMKIIQEIQYIQTVDVQTGELEVLSSLKGHFEALNGILTII
jgi:hypothetical protein